MSKFGGLAVACALALIAGTAAAELRDDSSAFPTGPRQPPTVAIEPCDLPAALKWSYELMSGKRTEAILNLDVIPTDRLADFRSAYGRFNAALDVAIDREIEVLGHYFLDRDVVCGAASKGSSGTVVEIEEAKTAALRDYVRALSSIMPEDQLDKLVETDLQMIRAIEVRLRNLAYQAVHARPAE
jgi:hypothetical protein